MDRLEGELRGPLKKMVQDRRSNVVRQIAVDVKTFAAEFAEVGLQHVTVDNLNTGPGVRLIFDPGANSGGQVAVGFDGDDAAPVTGQQLRQFAMAWANFDPGFARRERQGLQDFFAPPDVAEKMLPEPLPGHGWSECSNAGNSKQLPPRDSRRISTRMLRYA